MKAILAFLFVVLYTSPDPRETLPYTAEPAREIVDTDHRQLWRADLPEGAPQKYFMFSRSSMMLAQ